MDSPWEGARLANGGRQDPPPPLLSAVTHSPSSVGVNTRSPFLHSKLLVSMRNDWTSSQHASHLHDFHLSARWVSLQDGFGMDGVEMKEIFFSYAKLLCFFLSSVFVSSRFSSG